MKDALFPLLLAAVGLPVVVLVVVLVARHLVEKHADEAAAAILRKHARQPADRPKELTR
ncbi:hypothetical protein [Micromonospora terminaliae]|uniref:Uncharacterized protein n=1 Tax=Micromonospora terminaliae TaxID=1914461 RepID=A0AAJ3DM79_9ACTN|nr:hypothetical protein [Micromonospora terminaliae]NES28940.1 hypothetical protein [Micromonospora terminaliae]